MRIRQFRFKRQRLPELLRSLTRLLQLQKVHALLVVSEPICRFQAYAREKALRAFSNWPWLRNTTQPSASDISAAPGSSCSAFWKLRSASAELPKPCQLIPTPRAIFPFPGNFAGFSAAH